MSLFVSCDVGVLPNWASKGVLRFVVFGMSLKFSIIFAIFSSVLFLRWDRRSVQTSVFQMFVSCARPFRFLCDRRLVLIFVLYCLYKLFQIFYLIDCAWSHFFDRCVP